MVEVQSEQELPPHSANLPDERHVTFLDLDLIGHP